MLDACSSSIKLDKFQTCAFSKLRGGGGICGCGGGKEQCARKEGRQGELQRLMNKGENAENEQTK